MARVLLTLADMRLLSYGLAAGVLLAASNASASDYGVTGHIQGGFAERRLFDTSYTGGVGELGIGWYRRRMEAYVDFRLFLGSGEGLPLKQFAVGPCIDYELFPRTRFGIGGSFGGSSLGRRTLHASMDSFGVGGRIFMTFDLWRFDDDTPHSAIYVMAQVEAQTEGSAQDEDRKKVDTTGTWGPSIMLGARF